MINFDLIYELINLKDTEDRNNIITTSTRTTTVYNNLNNKNNNKYMACLNCRRGNDRERARPIEKPNPLQTFTRPILRLWECRACDQTYDKLWGVTAHAAQHGPPLRETCNALVLMKC